jgi:imidazolonepropionase-like amidohydrolase
MTTMAESARNHPVLYSNGALADTRAGLLRLGTDILVIGDVIAWIAPSGERLPPETARIVDCDGATFVPGLVDCHSHVTGPGGANWIRRFSDPPSDLLAVAEHNGKIALDAGVRWMRDVGSPIGLDPEDGRERALALTVRDRWEGRFDRPHIRAAGSWIFKEGSQPIPETVTAADGDELLEAALAQLADGADLIKLYMDGPDPDTSPWTEHEVRKVVEAAHANGGTVAAHSSRLAGARAAVLAGVDSIEHGFELDEDLARTMADGGTFLVTTLAVMRSWLSFADTTNHERFTAEGGRATIEARIRQAEESVRIAHRAGVALATGSDFGGGSLRANQLAWEVESLVHAGIEPSEAMAAATWRGGELLGVAEAGVIAEGGPADFFLVHGDPFSDPASLWRVWRTAWSP